MTELMVGAFALAVAGLALWVFALKKRNRELELRVQNLDDRLRMSDREQASQERLLKSLRDKCAESERNRHEVEASLKSKLSKMDENLSELAKETDSLRKKVESAGPGLSGDSAKALADSPLAGEVLQLLADGKPPVEVARDKGMQVGEVLLIQGLKQFSPKEGG